MVGVNSKWGLCSEAYHFQQQYGDIDGLNVAGKGGYDLQGTFDAAPAMSKLEAVGRDIPVLGAVATIAGQKIVGAVGAGLLKFRAGAAASRAGYVEGVANLAEKTKSMLASGKSVEEVARYAVNARNALKLETRSQGSWVLKKAAEFRNMVKYGNKLGPDAEKMLKGYNNDWQKVLNASLRTNEKINQVLGQ